MTITVMNAAVGVATATAMYLCGLGDPLLWGVTASYSTTFRYWDRYLEPSSSFSPDY